MTILGRHRALSRALLGWALLGLAPRPALAMPVLRLDSTQTDVMLGPSLEIHREGDSASILNVPEADWSPSTKAVPSMGMDDRGTTSYWVRFRVENPGNEAQTLFLANHYSPVDHLRLYELHANGHLLFLEEQGDQTRYDQRSVRHRFPVFRLLLTPGVHTFYLEQRSLGAISFPLKLWQPAAFEAFATRENLILGALIGSCVFVLLYNLFVFLRFRANVYFLYVLHNTTIGIFLANFLGFTQSVLLPTVSSSTWLNLGAKLNMDIIHITAIAFTVVFLDMKTNAPRLRKFLLFLAGLSLLTVLNTLTWQLWFNRQTALLSMVVSLSLLGSGIVLCRRFSYACYYTLSWSTLLVLNVITMFSILGITPTNIDLISWGQSVGHCFELCLLSLALGERMAWINRHREETLLELRRTQTRLLDERELHIQELDRKVEERTRDLRSILNNLQQGIFAIRWEGGRCLMEPDYSPYLHSILGAFSSATVNPLELLFEDSLLSRDEQSRVQSALISVFDGDAVAFEMNVSALPREIERGQGQDHRILEIDWDPVTDGEGRLCKILVAVRDVTEYRALRHRLLSQSEDIIIARDLLQEGAGVSTARLARMVADLEQLQDEAHAEDRSLLRKLHSLKGDSRTLQLKNLSEALHDAETLWIQNTGQPQKALAHALHLARRYHEICMAFERRFGKGLAPAGAVPGKGGVWLLQDLLAAELAQLPTLAAELGKVPPHMHWDPTPLALTEGLADALRESFGHILRNAMDHGLESPDERRQGQKSAAGQITVTIREEKQGYRISCRDDGRGLHLDAIRSKALALGLACPDHDEEALAGLIFLPEFSTKDQATLISGRGIGMDAVRNRLLASGGSITIELLADHAAPGYRHFQLHLFLPRFSLAAAS